MDIFVTRKSSSLTYHKWLKDEPSKCNGRCSNKQSQVINVKGQTVRTFDMLDCEFKKGSPYVEIAARKIPMDNKIICSHHIWFECLNDLCNGSETTDQIEEMVNKYYKTFYQELN